MRLFRSAVTLSAWLIATGVLHAAILADSNADFSGTQGARSWYYGYFANGDPTRFTLLPFYNAATQMWQQSAACCQPYTQVGANSFSHPNGTNHGEEQWAVREWRSTVSGQIFVSGRLSKVDISSNSNGVYGRMYLNHRQVAVTPLVTFENGVNYSVSVTVTTGDVIDIALSPNGPDDNDLSYLSAIISTTENTVEVDFSKPSQVHSASGFLFGIQVLPDGSPGLAPPQSTITPLNPVHWRTKTSPSWYRRVQAAAPNASVDFVMMDSYGAAANSYNGRGPPWLNFPAYETFIQSLVAPLSPAAPNMFFEPWNEPDDGWSPAFTPGTAGYHTFWDGTQQQFFDTYRHAFLAVRKALGPNAQVEGPAFAFYDRVTIRDFLEFCLANGCEVNSLSWHPLNDAAPDRAFITAKDARTSFLSNPRYAPLKIKRLALNELVGSRYFRQPAGTLAFYHQFELGGADVGNRACWADSTGANACSNGTLSGLLTPGTFQPRSVWWAHRAYADGVASRVESAVSDPNIVALSSSSVPSSGSPQILLAYVNYPATLQKTPDSRSFHLTLKRVDALSGIGRLATLGLRVELIPNTEESALAQPQLVRVLSVPIVSGTADVDLPALSLAYVYRITLVDPSAAAPAVTSVVDHAAGTVNLTAGMPIQVTGIGFGSSATDSAAATIGFYTAPVLTFVNSTKLIAQVPADAPPGPSALTVNYKGLPSAPFNIRLVAVAPQIEPAQSSSGSSFYDSSGTPITAARPAAPGTKVYCLAIGLGPTKPAQVTNAIATVPAPATAPAQVMVGNKAVQPDYAGLFVGGPPGYYQVSFQVPPDAAMGGQPVNLTAGGIASNTQTLMVGPPIPVFNTQGIVPATVQSGEWVSIYGTNLANRTATWAGDFPTALGGTSVTIGGMAGYLSYVSPAQINVQIPDIAATGVTPVVITNAAGSGSSTLTLAALGPYFFQLDGRHVAGIILRPNGGGAFGGGTYDILGPTGSSLGYPTIAATAGDVIELFGTGFGPTDPAVPAGQPFSGAAPAITPVTLRINNVNIAPTFVGLSGAGLFQFNVTVPSGLGTGDVPLQAIVDGVQTPAGAVIPLR